MQTITFEDEIWLGQNLIETSFEVEDWVPQSAINQFIASYKNEALYVAKFGGNDAVKKMFLYYLDQQSICEEAYEETYDEDERSNYWDNIISQYIWDPEDLISSKNALNMLMTRQVPYHILITLDFGNLNVDDIIPADYL